MILPESFTSSMKELLGARYDDFIASFDEKPLSGLRVNTSKISVSEFEKIAPYPVRRIDFVPDGFYIDDTDGWSKHPYYFAGLYYLQEPSAMLAADIMPVKSKDVILDLCAAPGGKSTKLATKDIGLLVSNDISFSRTLPLVKNLEHFGTGNFIVTASDPEKLYRTYGQAFDGIAVDAPCSGEGMFRKDRSLISAYEKKGSAEYCGTQKEILEYAYKMLRPGGHILYSTCTFSDMENEQVIISFLDEHDDMKTVPIDNRGCLSGAYSGYTGIDVYHFFPHEAKGEGHFIALMKKEGKAGEHDFKKTVKGNPHPVLPEEFLKYSSESLSAKLCEGSYNITDDGFVYLLPQIAEEYIHPHIRYARTGTLIGRIKNDRVTLSTAFALSLKTEDYENVLQLLPTDPEVCKYLKGETIVATERMKETVKKGYVLVTVSSYPLGFGIFDGSRIKNLYEKGWIMK